MAGGFMLSIAIILVAFWLINSVTSAHCLQNAEQIEIPFQFSLLRLQYSATHPQFIIYFSQFWAKSTHVTAKQQQA